MRKPSPRIDSARDTLSPPAAPEISRRRFLFALGAGSAGAAAAAASPVLAAPSVAAGAPDAAASGYRETEHVRDYYATTRL